MNLRKKTNKCVVLLLPLLLFGGILYAQQTVGGKIVKTITLNGKQTEVIEGEMLLKLVDSPLRSTTLDSIEKFGANVVKQPDRQGWMKITVPPGQGLDSLLISRFQKLPGVTNAQPNRVIRELALTPNDMDDNQWALNNTGQAPTNGTNDADIDTPDAWNITTGSSNVIIAILDSGIPMQNGQLSHPDLDDPNKIILGPDFIEDPNDPNANLTVRDERGHGTHVAGIAGAETDNNEGIAGVCWSCQLMVVQVSDAFGSASSESIHDGIDWAVDNGVDIINLSLGFDGELPYVETAIQYEQTNGVLIVAGTGNASNNNVFYPAAYSDNYSNVIAVSSTDQNDEVSTFSNSGSEVTMSAPGGAGAIQNGSALEYNSSSAPGTNIYSTTPNYPYTYQTDPVGPNDPLTTDMTQDYSYLAGTSMATPHVAGIAGLMLSADPCLTPLELRTDLRNSADKVPDMNGQYYTNEYGYGRANALGALREVLKPAKPTNLSVTNLGSPQSSPQLDWDDNPEPNIDYYRVYRRDLVLNSKHYFIGTASSSQYTDSQIHQTSSGNDITYYVRAVNTYGFQSGNSNTAMVQGESIFGKGLAAKRQELPNAFGIDQNYPNPFNPSTTINYALPEQAEVTLKVYNIMGRHVATLVNRIVEAGKHRAQFQGQGLASGMYIARLQAVGASGKNFTKELIMQLIK